MRVSRPARKVFRVLRRGHWLLWGNILFMTASALWLVSPVVAWTLPDSLASGIIGTTATSLYLVDAVVYFVDWWVKKMADEESVYGQKELAHTSFIQRFDFYFVGNICFLIGVAGDFVTAHFGETDPYWAYVCYAGSMAFWALYALLEMGRCTIDRINRDKLQASARFFFCPFAVCNRDIDRTSAVHVNFAWDMMGAIFFFLGSILYLFSAIIWYNVEFDGPLSNGYFVVEIIAAVLFILNSAVLFVNHGVMRWLKKGLIFYRDTDLETTRDAEHTRDREAITRDSEISRDAEHISYHNASARPIDFE